MKIIWLIIFTVLVFSACNNPAILIKNKDLSYTKMIQNLQGEKVNLELKSGKTLKGKITKFSSDTICIKKENIPLNNISKITHTKNTKDLKKALLFCSLIGSAAAISAELADDSNVVKPFLIFLFPFGLISDFTNKKDEYVLIFEDPSNLNVITN